MEVKISQFPLLSSLDVGATNVPVVYNNINYITPISAVRGVEVTTESVLELLQGDAEDQTRIGEEYIPESFSIISISLGNTGENSLPTGSIALNSLGELVLHDADRNGDEISPFALKNTSQLFAKTLTGASLNSVYLFYPLASFQFPASIATEDRLFTFSGTLNFLNFLSVNPDSGCYMAIRRKGEADYGKAQLYLLQTTTGLHRYEFQFMLYIDANSAVQIGSPGCGALVYSPDNNTPGNVTPVSAWYSSVDVYPTGNPNDVWTIGEPIDLEVCFVSLDDGGGIGGALSISGQIAVGHSI